MKNLKLIIMLVAVGCFLATTSCKKKKIEALEDHIAELQQDSTGFVNEVDDLTNRLNGAHGKYVLDHSVAGRDSAEFTVITFWVWFNEEGTPASTTSGFDIGPVTGTIGSNAAEPTFAIMGMPLGTHYIHGTGTVTLDTNGTPFTMNPAGGKNFEILEEGDCPSLHVHGE